jgi:hypothetical protein
LDLQLRSPDRGANSTAHALASVATPTFAEVVLSSLLSAFGQRTFLYVRLSSLTCLLDFTDDGETWSGRKA